MLKGSKSIFALDFGNSRVKCLLKKREDFHSEAFTYGEDFPENLTSYLERESGENCIIAYSSVNHSKSDFIKNIEFKGKEIEIITAEELVRDFEGIDFSGIEGMGVDRKLGLIGVWHVSKAPFITIDVGTAVTVNAVNNNEKCIGGAIFAGINTQVEALSEKAEALEKIELNETEIFPAENTTDAIRTGVIASTAGGVILLVEEISSKNFQGAEFSLFITGGGSELIYKIIKNAFPQAVLVPELINESIFSALGEY